MEKLVKKSKNNNITRGFSWSIVFEKIILFQYFKHNELVLLSSLDKKIRNALKPLILTHLSICNLLKKKEKDVVTSLDNVIKVLDSDILPISKSIKTVTISYALPFTNINPLFDHLLHINCLKIYGLTLDIISLNRLLVKLNSLKYLAINCAIIWIPGYLEEEKQRLNLPSNLVSLLLGKSSYLVENMEEEFQDFINYRESSNYGDIYNLFDSGALHPNLKIIELSYPWSIYVILDIPRILANNPSLNTLYINFFTLNQTNLELIKASNIAKLKMELSFGSSLDREFYQIPDLKLESIYEMEVRIPFSEPTYLAQLIELSKVFPMLKTLSIDYNGLNEQIIKKLLDNFPLLTRLNINIPTVNKKLKLSIENNSIKYLNISNINVLKLDCNSFAKWNNLKLIKLSLLPSKIVTAKNIDEHLKKFNTFKANIHETSTKSKNIHLFKA